MIEVLIAELTLTDSNSLLEFHMHIEAMELRRQAYVKHLIGTALGLSEAGVLASGGLTATFVEGNFLAVMNALASDNRVNVLASPQIIAADGKEASIDIGDEVPSCSKQNPG